MSQNSTNCEKDYYFSSYARIGIHASMLKDADRTLAYQDAIWKSRDLFRGKIVMDVGAGSGILSLFALKAGAARVYAIEFAENILEAAQHIIRDNSVSDSQKPQSPSPELPAEAHTTHSDGLGRFGDPSTFSNRMMFIKSRAEDIPEALVPPHSVDIIISEWMGYLLTYEGMLASVIHCRDTFLKRETRGSETYVTGLMFPDIAEVLVAVADTAREEDEAVEKADSANATARQDAVPKWSCLKMEALASRKPGRISGPDSSGLPKDALVEIFEPSKMTSRPHLLARLDLRTCSQEEASTFGGSWCPLPLPTVDEKMAHQTDQQQADSAKFSKKRARPDSPTRGKPATITGDALVAWFTCEFNTRRQIEENAKHLPDSSTLKRESLIEKKRPRADRLPVRLRTGPEDPSTHWQQVVLPLAQRVSLNNSTEKSGECDHHPLAMVVHPAKHNARDLGISIKYKSSDRDSRASDPMVRESFVLR